MATASLMAFPDMVFIDRKAGPKNGTTSIFYTGDGSGFGRPILWERIVGNSWSRIDLAPPRIFNSPSGDPERDGTFSATLRPGQVYQVVMYHFEFIDPNIVDPTSANLEQKPDASLSVVALLKDPERTNLIVSQDQNIGGTWFRKIVTTTVPTSFMLQVSQRPPFKDDAGMDRFMVPLGTVFDTSNVHHDREIEALLPGNDLFFLVRVVDDDGNWQVVSDQFRTKQRTVTINFEVMHIINDGANGDTTAEFRIWVMEGNTAVKDYFFGDVDNFPISDRPDPGKIAMEWIPLAPLCSTFILGPKDITDDTNEIGILTRGLCFRSGEANDWTSNFVIGDIFPSPKAIVPSHARFPFPTGGGENVQHVPFVVRTKQQVVDVEFEYDVTAFFTVNYT